MLPLFPGYSHSDTYLLLRFIVNNAKWCVFILLWRQNNFENQCHNIEQFCRILEIEGTLANAQFNPATFSYCIHFYIGTCIFTLVCMCVCTNTIWHRYIYICILYVIGITYSFRILYIHMYSKNIKYRIRCSSKFSG